MRDNEIISMFEALDNATGSMLSTLVELCMVCVDDYAGLIKGGCDHQLARANVMYKAVHSILKVFGKVDADG